jgi:hypothetical protein
LLIGLTIAYTGNKQINFFFWFIQRLSGHLHVRDGRGRFRTLPWPQEAGPFLLAFGILMPVLSASMGIAMAMLCAIERRRGGCSSYHGSEWSYIAAPAAMKIALPEANPTFHWPQHWELLFLSTYY